MCEPTQKKHIWRYQRRRFLSGAQEDLNLKKPANETKTTFGAQSLDMKPSFWKTGTKINTNFDFGWKN